MVVVASAGVLVGAAASMGVASFVFGYSPQSRDDPPRTRDLDYATIDGPPVLEDVTVIYRENGTIARFEGVRCGSGLAWIASLGPQEPVVVEEVWSCL